MTTKPLLEEQKEIVRQFFQRFSAGDIPGVLSLFRDDASYWLATTRETLDLGRLADGLKFVQSRLKGPIRYEIGTMVAEPNKIVAQVDGFGRPSRGPLTIICITSTSSWIATRSCEPVSTMTRPTSSTRYARESGDGQAPPATSRR
jgi:hypothetical protein